MLSTTFTPELLRTKLVAVGAWHPYPRATERQAWMQVPEDLRAAMVRASKERAGRTVFHDPARAHESGRGVFTVKAAKTGGEDASLRYDASALRFSSEKIELTDEGMRRSWGPALYRVQLRTTSDVAAGR